MAPYASIPESYQWVNTKFAHSFTGPGIRIQNDGDRIKKDEDQNRALQLPFEMLNRGPQESKYMYKFRTMSKVQGSDQYIGIARKLDRFEDFYRSKKDCYAYKLDPGKISREGALESYGKKLKDGDELTVLFDMSQGELRFRVNDIDQGLAVKSETLKSGVMYLTMFVYKADFELDIIQPPQGLRRANRKKFLAIFNVNDPEYEALLNKSIKYFRHKGREAEKIILVNALTNPENYSALEDSCYEEEKDP